MISPYSGVGRLSRAGPPPLAARARALCAGGGAPEPEGGAAVARGCGGRLQRAVAAVPRRPPAPGRGRRRGWSGAPAAAARATQVNAPLNRQKRPAQMTRTPRSTGAAAAAASMRDLCVGGGGRFLSARTIGAVGVPCQCDTSRARALVVAPRSPQSQRRLPTLRVFDASDSIQLFCVRDAEWRVEAGSEWVWIPRQHQYGADRVRCAHTGQDRAPDALALPRCHASTSATPSSRAGKRVLASTCLSRPSITPRSLLRRPWRLGGDNRQRGWFVAKLFGSELLGNFNPVSQISAPFSLPAVLRVDAVCALALRCRTAPADHLPSPPPPPPRSPRHPGFLHGRFGRPLAEHRRRWVGLGGLGMLGRVGEGGAGRHDGGAGAHRVNEVMLAAGCDSPAFAPVGCPVLVVIKCRAAFDDRGAGEAGGGGGGGTAGAARGAGVRATPAVSPWRHRGVGGRDGLTRAGCVRASWLATGEQAAPPPEP